MKLTVRLLAPLIAIAAVLAPASAAAEAPPAGHYRADGVNFIGQTEHGYRSSSARGTTDTPASRGR